MAGPRVEGSHPRLVPSQVPHSLPNAIAGPGPSPAPGGPLGRPGAGLGAGRATAARLGRPDGALARVRVVRWVLPELGALGVLRAVMLVDTPDAAPPVTSRDDHERQLAELRKLARV